jgi:alkylhydroperoxidase family enzyme
MAASATVKGRSEMNAGDSRSHRPGVPLLDADAPPLRAVEERGGRVNNLYRALANQPVLLEAWTNFAWTLRGRCRTPRPLRELLILRASQLADSRYIWEDHVRFGKEAGLSDDRIEQLSSWRDSPLFDPRERAALEFTESLVVDGRVEDAVLLELERRFTPDEVVELALTASFYTMAPRVVEALRVPLMSEARAEPSP